MNVLLAQKYLKEAFGLKNVKGASSLSFFVIRLGLEPKTPSLKGMCSTC